MAWSNRPDIGAGAYPRANQWEAILDQIDALTASGWANYTLSITASVTPPTQGNSTYAAIYQRTPDSDRVEVGIYILIGSTFSGGSGNYSFSLPVTAAAGTMATVVGNVGVLDSGTAYRQAFGWLNSTTTINLFRNGDAGSFSPTVPQTWATNDIITINAVYQAA